MTEKNSLTATESKQSAKKPVAKQKLTFQDIDLHEEVECVNMTPGVLVYENKKTGELVRWDHYGDVAIMEVGDLVYMRNTQRKFFEAPWIMIRDKAVLEYLRVDKYYDNIPDPDDFDDLFALTPTKLKKQLKDFSPSMKRLVAFRAIELIDEGILDSMKIINVLEDGLQVNLIER